MKTAQEIEQIRKNARKLIADKKLIYQYLEGKITIETLKENGIKLAMPI